VKSAHCTAPTEIEPHRKVAPESDDKYGVTRSGDSERQSPHRRRARRRCGWSVGLAVLVYWSVSVAILSAVAVGSKSSHTPVNRIDSTSGAAAPNSVSFQALLRTSALGAKAPLGTTSPVRSATNSATFQDSIGEDPQAPDITTVVVSNDDARMITFRINVPNRPQLTSDMIVDLLVDTDRNPSTGDSSSLGADYAIQLFLGQLFLYRWDGTNFTRNAGDPPAATLSYAYSGGVTIRINAAELGNTTTFSFGTAVISGVVSDPATGNVDFSNARADLAPEINAGFYGFEVRLTPPPPPAPPRPEPKTFDDASRLPSRIQYVGKSIKHVRIGEKLYLTMKRLARMNVIRVPRTVAVACWSKLDWPSVLDSADIDASPALISGFWLPVQPRWVHVSPKQCVDVQALINSRVSNGHRAYALTTVLHERVHAEGVRVEAETECYAVQLVYDFARELNFVFPKAMRLEQLAVRKSRAVAPRAYWDPTRCRDGGKWDLFPQFRNLDY
jgi:hypothetical protein